MHRKNIPTKYPKGWNAKQIKELADHYERQSEDQAVAERVHYFFLYRRNQNSRLKSL